MKLSSECEDEVNQILYFGYRDSLFYNKNENKWYNDYIQIPRKRLLISRLRIALPNKILIENINVLKAEIDKEYVKDSSNLFENIQWALKSEINKILKIIIS